MILLLVRLSAKLAGKLMIAIYADFRRSRK